MLGAGRRPCAGLAMKEEGPRPTLSSISAPYPVAGRSVLPFAVFLPSSGLPEQWGRCEGKGRELVPGSCVGAAETRVPCSHAALGSAP